MTDDLEPGFPLQWPDHVPRTPPHRVGGSSFQVEPGRAHDDLVAAVSRMGGKNLVISTNQPRKKDGGLNKRYVGRALSDCGVAIYFSRRNERMAFACDRYSSIWENKRGIYMTLEALRTIERHGTVQMQNQAFRGFAALPPPDPGDGIIAMSGPDKPTKPWNEVLGVSKDAPPAVVEAAYKALCRDQSGASAELNAAIADFRRGAKP